MKKLLLLLLVSTLVISCNPKSSDGKKTSDSVVTSHEEHTGSGAGLELNNGSKWKVDSITKVNVALLKESVAAIQQNKLSDFKTISGQLQDGLNKLINECKMTGADHEALHKWLEPLLGKAKDLNEATAANGPTLVKEISDHLNIFDNYFE